MAASLFSLAQRSYPCTKTSSGRSTKCWQPGQVRDQWLSFRFRGALLTMVLSIAVIALKDNTSCWSNCGRLHYCSGDSLPFPGRVLIADLARWLALVNKMGVEWHLSLLGSQKLKVSVQSTILLSLPLRWWKHVTVKLPAAWVSEILRWREHPLHMECMSEKSSLLL